MCQSRAEVGNFFCSLLRNSNRPGGGGACYSVLSSEALIKNAAIRFVAIVALMGTPALAADMAVKAPPPPVAAPTYSWTGFYIGGDIGGLQTSNTATWNPLPSPIAFGEYLPLGALAVPVL